MFDSVPAEMVTKLLERGYEVARGTAARATEMAASRARIRASLLDASAIVEVPEDALDCVTLGDEDVSAVDGAYICDNQSIGDLCTAVAVAVGPRDGEGHTDVFMDSVPRSARNKDMIAGVMAGMEILMASRSQAKVVLVDGSLVSGLLTLSTAIMKAGADGSVLSERLRLFLCEETRSAVLDMLSGQRFVALPKYTTQNELRRWLPDEFHQQDAKTLATMALRPGEMTEWIEREAGANSQSGLVKALGFEGSEADRAKALMEEVVSCYYRPHAWSPAFRLDVASRTADDPEATTMIFKAIRDNTMSSGILEPFPLYLVDQYAKQISNGAAPMVSMAAMENIDDDDAQLLLAARYRT